MNNSKSKNDIFYLILLVLTIITMLVGITFTYFSLIAKEKEDSTKIQTGTISINYIDGKEINTYALLPIDEPTLNTKYSVYQKRFSISSDGTLDQYMDMYIDVTKNEFAPSALGFILYDSDNNKIAKGWIPKVGKVLMASNIYLKSGETKNFTVLIWLQENNQNQDYEQGNTFVGGFDIDARQIKYE